MREGWFRTYLADALESLNDCYVEQVSGGGQFGLLEVSKETYEASEEV